MSGAIEFNSFEDFLGYHSGGRVGFFGKWKKSVSPTRGAAVVVLHKTQLPMIVLQHQGIPRIRNYEKKGEEVTELWGGQWVCWEDKSILETAGKGAVKLSPAGAAHWPAACGQCRMNAHVAEQVFLAERERKAAEKAKRKIDVTIGIPFWTPLFRFSAEDSQKDDVVYAGALVGMLPTWKELGDEAKKYVKQSGLPMGPDAWNKKNLAKPVTLFTLVGVASPLMADGSLPDIPTDEGMMIAEETDMLREKVVDEANKSIKRLKERGNPWHQPFPFLWEFDREAARAWDMYAATALPDMQLPADVLALVTGPAPDISGRKRPHNQTTMRAYLEQHAEVQIPWDKVYAVPKLSDGQGDDDFPFGANAPEASDDSALLPEEKGPAPEVGREQPAGERPPAAEPKEWQKPRAERGPFPLVDDPAGEDVIASCSDGKAGCGKLMWIEDHTCPHCGYVWDQAKRDAELAEKARAEAAAKADKPRTARPRGGAKKDPPLDPLPPDNAPAAAEGKRGQQVGGDKIGF